MRSRCAISRADSRRLSVRFRPEGWDSSRSSPSATAAAADDFERKGNRITMLFTLLASRDRRGHPVPVTPVILVVFALLALAGARPAAAGPGDYKATRFDVAATAAHGDLDVTERVTFQFQSGTFTYVWRDIPVARTDGIQ